MKPPSQGRDGDTPLVLVVEDDEIMRLSLLDRLRIVDIPALSAGSLAEARQILGRGQADILVTDIRLPDGTGRELFHDVLRRTPRMPVILATAYGSVAEAVELVKAGAADYLTKPFSMDAFIAQVQRAIDRVMVDRDAQQIVDDSGVARRAGSGVLGPSPAMRSIERLVARIAEVDSSVLISGESGVGKEVIANLIHRNSRRASAPFIKINCAAIPANLVESELFGHEKGAFTGAERRHIGRFEQAQGGTLLLDEIAEISLDIQVKLLRVLQERALERVGGRETIDLDIRLLAATQVDLQQAIELGRFRPDLFWRLNVIHISVPPLRDRAEDIPFLAQRFVRHFAAAMSKAVDGIEASAEAQLLTHPFPGNVRELKNLIERAVALCEGRQIAESDLLLDGSGDEAADGDGGSLREAVERTERNVILQALTRCQWHVAEAAQALGISRKNLWEKMRRYDIRR